MGFLPLQKVGLSGLQSLECARKCSHNSDMVDIGKTSENDQTWRFSQTKKKVSKGMTLIYVNKMKQLL